MSNNGVRSMACLLLLSALAGGCGSGSGSGSDAPAPSPAGGSPSVPTSTAPVSSTPPAPSPGAAANGTDLAACEDGDCEVYASGVVTIPLDQRFGFTRFEVAHEPTGRSSVFGEDPVNGNLHAYVNSTGEISANGITMTVISTDATGAVLRFTPRAE